MVTVMVMIIFTAIIVKMVINVMIVIIVTIIVSNVVATLIIVKIVTIVVIAESSSSSSTAAPGLQTKTALSGRRCAMRGGTCTFCLFFCLFFFFYWTLVRSLFIIVNGSLTHSCSADLTDVTLADEDTCSMLFDGLNWDYW